MFRRRWKLIIGLAIVVIALVGALGVPAVMADTDDEPTTTLPPRDGTCIGCPGPLGPGAGCGPIADGELLADALGITVEELQAAIDEAREGLVGQPGLAELLANALGITVEELQDAREAAFEARLAQAVAEGCITQEQADMILARRALADYLDRDAIKDAIRAIYEDAVQQAVIDGVITQEQADAILSGGGLGLLRGQFCGPAGPGYGPGIMHMGPGMMGGKTLRNGGPMGGCGGCGAMKGGWSGFGGGLGESDTTGSSFGGGTTAGTAL